ncbi:MAG TPA: hypothetical protein VGX37_13125 [Allosphingosinicella sp.]|nr:hypothetical protein [Allosphingosinicella sp.]
MQKATLLKGAGYVASMFSVALLGAVAWKSASENPLILTMLIGGMATSVAGMLLRWMSYWERQEK